MALRSSPRVHNRARSPEWDRSSRVKDCFCMFVCFSVYVCVGYVSPFNYSMWLYLIWLFLSRDMVSSPSAIGVLCCSINPLLARTFFPGVHHG